MLKLIGTVEKGQPVLVCVAGNLCSPEVFDQVKLPADMARLYVDYLGKEGPWDMDSLGWQLIDQLKKMLWSDCVSRVFGRWCDRNLSGF